jgi:hypothetical protein
VKFLIHKAQQRYAFRYEEIDISQPTHAQWLQQYDYHIPVVHVNEVEIARHGLKEQTLTQQLERVNCKKI